MRADRLVSILMLLQVHRRITSRELAQRLEVSERTIHRDMDALSIAGVPLTAERGAGGGWSLPGGYRTSLTGMTAGEVQALFLATPTRLMADLGLSEAQEAALRKLLASLPAAQRRDAEYMRQRIHVDSVGWKRGSEEAGALGILQEALWQDRRVSFAYRRADGSLGAREVDPLGLVAKGNVWYLVAVSEGELRTYRVSRINSARVTAAPAHRPDGFDLPAYWAQSAAEFTAALPRYTVTIRAAPAVLERLHRMDRWARVEEQGEADSEGWYRLTVRFELESDALEAMLGFGPRALVVEPADLRERVVRIAGETVSFYAERYPQRAAPGVRPWPSSITMANPNPKEIKAGEGDPKAACRREVPIQPAAR